jgi:hypothetical protein
MTVRFIQKSCLNISYFVMTYSIIRYIYFNIDLFILLFTQKNLNKTSGETRSVKIKNVIYFETEGVLNK